MGVIKLFAGNFAPQYYMFCHGQTLSIAQNTALFSIIGTMYGGNGTTTFNLPDLRSRVPVGVGQGPGLSNVSQGQAFGTETVTLNANQIPAHTHAATVTINAGGDANLTNIATNHVLSSDDPRGDAPPLMYTDSANATKLRPDAATATVAPAGGSQAHPNIQPSLGLNYIICVQGIFPPRS